MQRLLAMLFSAVLALPGHAAAHALLERSQPAADAHLNSAPDAVRLWFSRAIEPAFSTVQVRDRDGNPVSQERGNVSDQDPKLLQLVLPPLSAGTYKVIWRIVALDGHEGEGEFSFTLQ